MTSEFLNPPSDQDEIRGWVKRMTLDELETAKVHFYDRWNWDSGSDDDLDIYNLLVKEIEQRNMLSAILNTMSEILGEYRIPDETMEKIIFDSPDLSVYTHDPDIKTHEKY